MAAYFKLKVLFGARTVIIFLHPELAERSGQFRRDNPEIEWTPEGKLRNEGDIGAILDKWEKLGFPIDSQSHPIRAFRILD